MSRMRVCQHCNEGFELAATGRPPKFCSATCRKAAWEAEKLRQAIAVAKAQAVAAERRRVARLANRGNETPVPADNRGNETPPQARDPRRAYQVPPPAAPVPAEPEQLRLLGFGLTPPPPPPDRQS